jgi:hypothetical protein
VHAVDKCQDSQELVARKDWALHKPRSSLVRERMSVHFVGKSQGSQEPSAVEGRKGLGMVGTDRELEEGKRNLEEGVVGGSAGDLLGEERTYAKKNK